MAKLTVHSPTQPNMSGRADVPQSNAPAATVERPDAAANKWAYSVDTVEGPKRSIIFHFNFCIHIQFR